MASNKKPNPRSKSKTKKNPKTGLPMPVGRQFSSEDQPENRRGKSIMGLIDDMMFNEEEYLLIEKLEVIDDDNNVTGEVVRGRVKLLKADRVKLRYGKWVMTSEQMMRHYCDHNSGKATEKLKIEVDEGTVIEYKIAGFGVRKKDRIKEAAR